MRRRARQIRRILARLMLAFVLATALPTHFWWADGENQWTLLLLELGLIYSALVAIMVEEDA